MITFDYKSSKRQGQIITDSDTLGMIRSHFSVKNDGAFFAKKKGNRFVKDRKYAITPTGLFDFGFHGEILKYLRDNQITDISLTDAFKKRLKCGVEIGEFWNELKYDARYYQKDSVIAGLKKGFGTFLLATSAGKSLAQALLVENYMRNVSNDTFKCLIVVPGLSLVNQLQGDFEDYGVTFTYSGWTGGNEPQDTQVVICNSENLLAQFTNNPWILSVNLLICDEAHKINNTAGISKIINKIHTPNKFGFTGTLSDKSIDQWKTIGTFGSVIYEKKSKELRDEGYISDVEITALQLNHPPIKGKKLKYKDELEYLYKHEKRNQIIAKLADSISGNVLVMVNHLDHGDMLLSLMSSRSDKRVFFVKGEMEVEERKKIIDMMEKNDNIICIAMASIFSTGINIKNLPNIIFAGLGKSFIRVVQSIGRGLRLHDNKSKLRIIDVSDNLKYSMSHALHRQEIYDKEQIVYKFKEVSL
jgi:superfamily II DNA or RNA helicase